MTPQMGLTLSALLFVGLHFLMSHALRGPLVRGLGESAFRIVYSIVSLLAFGAMIYFYRTIGREPQIWAVSEVDWGIAALLMWFAAILFVGSFPGNPAIAGARGPSGPPRGVLAITRHPMMWSFAIWAATHLLVVATAKALVLDVAIFILALVGAAMQDRKKRRLVGDRWRNWTAQTAFVPFGRGLALPGWTAFLGGTALYLLATWLHPLPVGPWRWIG